MDKPDGILQQVFGKTLTDFLFNFKVNAILIDSPKEPMKFVNFHCLVGEIMSPCSAIDLFSRLPNINTVLIFLTSSNSLESHVAGSFGPTVELPELE